MSEQLLTVLKFCLLALLYLFFLRVLRAVWTEMNPPKVPATTGGATKAAKKPRGSRRPARAAGAGHARGRATNGVPSALVVVEPLERSGMRIALGQEETIGRSAGCSIIFDERYVSQVHTRLFQRGGTLFVEDLGSTNGTWINGSRAVGQMPMRTGDRIQIGNLVMEAR